MDAVISDLATIGANVELGYGTKVWQGATVCDGAQFGKRCVIGTCAWVGKGVRAGDEVRIQHGVFVPNSTVIGDRVFIGPNVTLTDDRYPVAGNKDYLAEPPVIEDDVSIGAGAVILPGVRIWKGAMIGAGAIVTMDVPPGTVVRSMFAAVVTGPPRKRRIV